MPLKRFEQPAIVVATFTLLKRFFAGACLIVLPLSTSLALEPAQVIDLWPGGAPGEKGDIGEERDLTKPSEGLVADKPVIRLGNVSKPTLSIYRPPAGKETGAAETGSVRAD